MNTDQDYIEGLFPLPFPGDDAFRDRLSHWLAEELASHWLAEELAKAP